MSLTVGVASSSKDIGFDDKQKGDEKESQRNHEDTETETSHETEDEYDDEDAETKIDVGPQCTLKELSEKDKDDESLRRWKEQLLGSVDINSVGESLDPEVKILNLAIKSPGRDDIVLQIPEHTNPKGSLFVLKEGSHYNLRFTFRVSNNIVSGLVYKNTVWRAGVKVYTTKEMIGTFSPQTEPYTHEMPEETTPSGIFARGSYSARTQFLDDDKRCYLELNYTFDIKREWQSQKH